MSSERVPRRFRRLAQVFFVLAAVGAVAWLVAGHFAVRSHLAEATAALDRGNPAEARRHLDRYLEARPNSAEGHLLAARAARRCGDLAAAAGHLKEAQRSGAEAAPVELESALMAAQDGRFFEVQGLLLTAVAEGHPQSAEILALAVPARVAEFRIPEARGLTARWVELEPDSARAWTHHAEVLERLRRKAEAIEALRRVVALAPDDVRARVNLGRMLLEVRQSLDEAAGHLERAVEAEPHNPAALLQLAACRETQGRADDAAALLDRLVVEHPRDAKAYFHRGRLELNRARPADSLPFLRKSAELDPSDPEALYSLFQCVQRVGAPAEAREAEERWRRADADLKRVAELARLIAASPGDPELRREMGELFLRNGRDADGVRWLESALQVGPDHAPTHAALAAHYEKVGRPDLAARHRGPAAKKP